MFSVILPCEIDRQPYLERLFDRYCEMMATDLEYLVITRSVQHIHNEFLNIKIIPYKWDGAWVNPSHAMNLGVAHSTHEMVIINSPEVLPITDCVDQFRMRRQLDCIVATVFEGNIPLVSANFRNQHPGFYFLAMYKKSLIEAMNGWDEDFMAGVGYDDNDFGERWVRSGYSYEISPDIVAEHQHHDRNDQSGMLTNASLLNRNREHNVTRCKNGLVKE